MILKIGTTPLTTEVMPYPIGEDFNEQIKFNVEKLKTNSGNMKINLSGREKREFKLNFQFKNNLDYNKIKKYCNTYPEVYVILSNNSGSIIKYANFSFCELREISNQASPDDGLRSFTITIYEL
jgi:hypothetical protein